jgi:hypothetical protein
MKAPEMTKELLFCWVAGGLQVLVPKRRGTGYLRAPYGHHNDQALNRIADLVRCDVHGLDGALYFECSSKVYLGAGEELRNEFAEKIIKPLEEHYGFPSRFVNAPTFWALHPLS